MYTMPEELLIPRVLAAQAADGLSRQAIYNSLVESLAPLRGKLKRVLLVPPDFTRYHSNAGLISSLLYELLSGECEVNVLPALGTHVEMSRREWEQMYAPVPYEKMLIHNWRTDVVKLGEIPGSFVAEVSEGLMKDDIPVELNKHLLDPGYDLILSIGQVVPHEVAGMANHTKNIFVGCGGSAMINASHMLGALYGMERVMGRDRTPVRAVFDYAAEHFLADMPLSYILTVTDAPQGNIRTHGLFIGRDRSYFEQATELAARINMDLLDRPIQKAVVYLDEQEFKSTWLGNKAIYRVRMAMARGGELVILAPGVERFGEDRQVDRLIRAWGYRGRKHVLEAVGADPELAKNLSAAAHLIHGSSEGRFSVTYCTTALSREEVEGVGFDYLPYEEAIQRYDPAALQPGYNRLADGEEIFFIPNPALGLWAERSRFAGEAKR